MDSLRFTSGAKKPRASRPRKRTAVVAGRQRKCDFCPNTAASYTCSQCDASFCSSNCFRSERHLECAEHFYKKCVLEHLKHTRTDKEEQARLLEILKRNSGNSEDIIDYTDLLQEDLDSVNLDLIRDPHLKEFTEKLVDRFGPELLATEDLDKAWFALSDDEKGEFISLVNKNGKLFDSLVSEWKPWWMRGEWQRPILVEEDTVLEVSREDSQHQKKDDDEEEEEEEAEGYGLFPKIYRDIERFSKLTSKTPSPTIPASLICTIFAYCHLCRLYNGEIACSDVLEDADETTTTPTPEPEKWSPELIRELFRLCPFLDPDVQIGKLPENASQALDASLSCLFAYEGSDVFFERKLTAIELLYDVRTIFDYRSKPGRILVIQSELSSDARESSSILRTPKALVLALSDLIRILERVQAGLAVSEDRTESKRIELAKRKLLFYLSWSVELGVAVLEPLLGQLLQAIDMEIEKLKQENLLFEQESQEALTKPAESQESKKPLIEEIN